MDLAALIVSIVVGIVAIGVAARALFDSKKTNRDNRLISNEQKRQESRLAILETEFLLEEYNRVLKDTREILLEIARDNGSPEAQLILVDLDQNMADVPGHIEKLESFRQSIEDSKKGQMSPTEVAIQLERVLALSLELKEGVRASTLNVREAARGLVD